MRVKYETRTINGTNPLREELERKRQQLENYQTSRTAREFYETILANMARYDLIPLRRMFLRTEYCLHFIDPRKEEMRFTKFRNGSSRAVRIIQDGQNRLSTITVESLLAGFIPGLWKDIAYQRNKVTDEMPVGVRINGKASQITYSGTNIGPSPIRFS